MAVQNFSPQDRYAVIADLSKRLEGVSPQFGKTVLVKLMYLLQEVHRLPLGYRFSFYTYGPYSPQVVADLDLVNRLGGVNVKFMPGEPGGFEISPGAHINDVQSSGQIYLEKYANEVDSLVSLFGQFRARDLELRSTIVYLWKEMGLTGNGTKAELLNVVRQLKPQFSEGEIDEAVSELLTNGVIERNGELA